MKRKALIFLILLFAADLSFGQGCSQCRMLAEQSSELSENSFASNINYGILYLIAVPYLLLMFLFRKKIAELFRRFRKA